MLRTIVSCCAKVFSRRVHNNGKRKVAQHCSSCSEMIFGVNSGSETARWALQNHKVTKSRALHGVQAGLAQYEQIPVK